MSFLENFKSGNLVLPSALLFHYKDIFKSSDDFLIWQFIYLQNTTKMDDLAPSQIATALDKTVAEVNRSISDLTAQGLLDMKTIELGSEIEVIFDASPVLALLDDLLAKPTETQEKQALNPIKELVEDFERELGRMLSPFELEDLQKQFVRTRQTLIWFGQPFVKLFLMVKLIGIISMRFYVIGVVRVLQPCVKLRNVVKSMRTRKQAKYPYQMIF